MIGESKNIIKSALL